MSVELPCPRCGVMMAEVAISKKWLAHFACLNCDSCWHFIGMTLVQGRELRLQVVPISGPHVLGQPQRAAVSKKPWSLEP